MSEISNPGREHILARIEAALKQKTEPPASEATPIFFPVEDNLARFQEECKSNFTECFITDHRQKTIDLLRDLLQEIPPGEIFVEDTFELRSTVANTGRPLTWSTQRLPNEQAQATITRCHALVAVTGSVLTSSACGGRGASVVAPVHIVLAYEDQIVAGLEDALDLVQKEAMPQTNSFVGLITGSSRTSDIEKLLVLGAHGPKRLIVIIQRKR